MGAKIPFISENHFNYLVLLFGDIHSLCFAERKHLNFWVT